ncbi:phosphoglycerate kinase [Pancytospora philotis]|nr:phosphoglycerate kinase [Pancytospora philotis]
MASIADLPLTGKNVLVIADFNVPIASDKVLCAYKIDQTLPTINHVLGAGCRSLTLASHLGRPKSKSECSLQPVCDYLKGIYPSLAQLCVPDALKARWGGNPDKLRIVDNIRYYDDAELARLYGMYDLVINEAFGCIHRPALVDAHPGLLMQKEIEQLHAARDCDLVIIGGAKIAEKLKMAQQFEGTVFIGGCLSLTIYKALGYQVGHSTKAEPFDCSGIKDQLVIGRTVPESTSEESSHTQAADTAHKTRQVSPVEEGSDQQVRIRCTQCHCGSKSDNTSRASPEKSERKRTGTSFILPTDFMTVMMVGNKREYKAKRYDCISEDDTCIDIGPESTEHLAALVRAAGAILWNGPLGKFENEGVSSTAMLVKLLDEARAKVVAGGGETVSAIIQHSDGSRFAHISTGGGAMLAFLGGGKCPALDRLIK